MSKCPWHAGKVVIPCTLSGCDFFAQGHPLHCGFVAYQKIATTLKNNEEISWDILGTWLDVSPTALEQQAKEAYTALKRTGIEHFFLGSLIPVEQTRFCVVCEKPASLTEGAYAYCSTECKAFLPPEAVKAEKTWEHPFATLLRYLQPFDFKTVLRYVKVSKDLYASLLWKHLGTLAKGVAAPPKKKQITAHPRLPSREELIRRVQLSRLWRQT